MDSNGNYKSLKSILLSLLLILVTLCTSCKKEVPSIKGGSFTFQEKKYPVSAVRYDHIGYNADGKHIIRFIAYPATYSFNYLKGTCSGTGAVIKLFINADDRFLAAGNSYSISEETDSTLSALISYSETDTVYHFFDNANLDVDTVFDEATDKYYFQFVIEAISEGDSISGKFIGTPISNITVDQLPYGELNFDTIQAHLCRPALWHWGNLFSESYYHEFTFFSADARFNDKGNITRGIQFVIGISTTESTISPGIYPVSYSYEANTTLYGHKLNNTPWGTYWQIMENQSAIGKANILSDTLIIDGFTEKNLNIRFTFTDQLKNTVTGNYNGPYNEYNL